MKSFFLGLLLLLPWVSRLQAQAPADSVLQVVEIIGVPYQAYTIGTKLQQLDSATLQARAGEPLSQLLLKRSPLYLKEYGPGQVATVSFRGTGANHTAVLWNGLPMNSPTLGQTDFSLIPAFALSDVQVQYGASSALYGSGALGGSIHLQSTAGQREGSSARLRLEAGSFGRLFTGAAAALRTGRWQSDTRIYRQVAENDFPYRQPNGIKEINRNSAFAQQGVVQNLSYRSGSSGLWQLNAWWQQTRREVQPQMGDHTSQDRQQDQHLRLNLQYDQQGAVTSWQVRGGWVEESLLHNASPFRSRQLIADAQLEYFPVEKLSVQAGARFNHIGARNSVYVQQAEELRTSLFAMLRWSVLQDWTLDLNLRQLLVAGYEVPLTPSLGMQGTVFQRDSHILALRLSAGRAYRVPTLNDRFWPVVGNPSLKPETSWNTEAGLDYTFKRTNTQEIRLSQTVYSLWAEDFILWRPAVTGGSGNWEPRNLQKVHSRGLESQLEINQKLPKGLLSIGGNMAYTRATNEEAIQQHDWTLGKQLAFTPYWRAAAWSQLQLNKWSAGLDWQYTSRRYTNGAELAANSLPGFSLFDLSLGRSFAYRSHGFYASLQVQNLFNEDYQNYERRAMPGRSFLLVLDYQLKL